MYNKPLSANPTKWSNTLKQFVAKLPTNCLSVFDHFLELAIKGLTVTFRSVFRTLSNIYGRTFSRKQLTGTSCQLCQLLTSQIFHMIPHTPFIFKISSQWEHFFCLYFQMLQFHVRSIFQGQRKAALGTNGLITTTVVLLKNNLELLYSF